MKALTTTLRLSLSSLLPTSFPALEQALIDESNARLLPFREFLAVTSFAEEISYERRRALGLLTTLRNVDDADVAQAIHNLTADSLVHSHASVYLLYLLGAYTEAGDAVEAVLHRSDPQAYATIASVHETYMSAGDLAASIARELVGELPVLEQGVRVKRPAAILAKLVSQRLRSPDRGASLEEWLSVELKPPYDIVGCRLIVDSSRDSRPFDDLVGVVLNVCRAFSDHQPAAEIHRRYSLGDVEGASILFATREHVPLQIQLWNVAASRFEWLCHGNHKVNHRLAPLIPAWLELCARPIEPAAYVRAVARRWAVS